MMYFIWDLRPRLQEEARVGPGLQAVVTGSSTELLGERCCCLAEGLAAGAGTPGSRQKEKASGLRVFLALGCQGCLAGALATAVRDCTAGSRTAANGCASVSALGALLVRHPRPLLPMSPQRIPCQTFRCAPGRIVLALLVGVVDEEFPLVAPPHPQHVVGRQ
mmetsp:Transcript_37811/g.66636  ORF Transcript_37811/g.66636 Transcript_37811/m.66636 type:complete len:163 (-) Transcript_37811:143-631(-)